MTVAIRTPFEPPEIGEFIQVAEGVLWSRMPLPKPLEHVNVYLLEDSDGWTVVDTGIDSESTRHCWERLLASLEAGRPVRRVVVTHHHLDHVGLAGWFVRTQGAELVMTRTAYLMARMLQLDVQERPSEELLRFWRRCGMAEDVFQTRESSRPFNTSDRVAPIPLGFAQISDGDKIEMGGRVWDVRCGNGHAPEHATFWEQGGSLVIGGDQLLGTISPNLGVYATQPDDDTVGAWLASCQTFKAHARPDHLVLPGHRLPFFGLPTRLAQLVEEQDLALKNLLSALQEQRTACGCFDALFKRPIRASEYGLAMAEAMAHCNHLYRTGRISREIRADGAYLWHAKAP